jgi:hypothetical protein
MEFVQAMHTLTLSILVVLVTETIVTLCHLHPLHEVDLFTFVDDFHPKIDFVLDKKHLFLL